MIHLEILLQILENNPEKDKWASFLYDLLPKYDINNINRVAHFFAQVCHESNDFTQIEENLNYSATELVNLYPDFFKDVKIATKYENQPEKIANLIYANKMGNGDELSGDGYKYRGRGVIQLKGRAIYDQFSDEVFFHDLLINDPDAVITNPAVTIHSVCWLWKINNLNEFADNNDIEGITKIISGNLDSLLAKQERLEKYKFLLNANIY